MALGDSLPAVGYNARTLRQTAEIRSNVPTTDRTALGVRLREGLVAAASPAGGWAYYAGKSSRIEPTA
jgi:hypothetical protein